MGVIGRNYFSLFDGLGEKITNKLDSGLKTPWFFYIHINDLHQPIVVPKDFDDKKFGDTDYDRMVSAIDFWIGNFLQKVDLKDTLVVVTADHGEYIRSLKINDEIINLESGMGEKTLWKLGNKVPPSLYGTKRKMSSIIHKVRSSKRDNKIKNLNLSEYQKRVLTTSRMSTGSHVYDDVLRVPLILSGNSIENQKIISQQASIIDIFPTIVELLGIDNLNSKIDGTSLCPLFFDKTIEEKPIFIQSMPHISKEHQNFVGIRTHNFKYIRDSKDKQNFQLFNLIDDPLEEKDISKENPEIIFKMEAILENYLDQKIDSSKMNNEERKKVEDELKKLGYV